MSSVRDRLKRNEYMRNWRKRPENHARVLKAQRSSYRKHREERRKHGRAYYQKTRIHALEMARRNRELRPEISLWRLAKRRAQIKKRPFTISVADVKTLIDKADGICPALGIELVVAQGKQCPASMTLDAFVPIEGYTKENTELISYMANAIKSAANTEQVRAVYKWMRRVERRRKRCQSTSPRTSQPFGPANHA